MPTPAEQIRAAINGQFSSNLTEHDLHEIGDVLESALESVRIALDPECQMLIAAAITEIHKLAPKERP